MTKGKGTYSKVSASKSSRRKPSTTQTVKKKKKFFNFTIGDWYSEQTDTSDFIEFARENGLQLILREEKGEVGFMLSSSTSFLELYTVDEYGKVKMFFYNFAESNNPINKGTVGTAKNPKSAFSLIKKGMKQSNEIFDWYAERDIP